LENQPKIPIEQFLALDQEVRDSINLLQSGLGELQNISFENDFYFLPFLILSNGIERLLKIIICLNSWSLYGKFPITNDIKTHDLVSLNEKVLSDCFSTSSPALQDDYSFITSNNTFKKFLHYLSEFGRYSRFYNLDVVTQNPDRKSMDIQRLWEKLETNLLMEDDDLRETYLENMQNMNPEKFEKLKETFSINNKKITILIERYIRALVRQFTLGKFRDTGQQFSGVLRNFLFLEDSELGNHDYRR